jgi:hypothetical protein
MNWDLKKFDLGNYDLEKFDLRNYDPRNFNLEKYDGLKIDAHLFTKILFILFKSSLQFVEKKKDIEIR